MRISMWSGPRNISTAIMYSFRQRSDMEVFDEPLYGHYLVHTGIDHPGRLETMAAMECDVRKIIDNVLLADGDTKHRFYKNMGHHLVGVDLSVLNGMTNILLTREPREMLPSLFEGFPGADIDSTGLVNQIGLLDMMLARNEVPIVLDSRQVLLNPKVVLSKLCNRLEIPWEVAMLSWEAGPKPEDGLWARHWYANVHRSTGFAEYRPKTEPFPDHLRTLLERCMPLYDRLREFAIQA